MPGARPRNADLTGRTLKDQQGVHADELNARRDEITIAHAADARALENEVVDYSVGSDPVIVDTVIEPIEVTDDWRVIRTNEDLEDVTIGVGNLYSFRAGQKTKVPAFVADHLEEKGYVWH